MIKNRTDLKSRFEEGDKPEENDFIDLIDSFFHKEEDIIPIESIEKLEGLLLKKLDVEAFNAFAKQIKGVIKNFNLSNTPTYINYDYFGEKVFGVLLQIPNKENNKYLFNHSLNIEKYLRLEVWKDGIELTDAKGKTRQDLTEVIYSPTSPIGEAEIGQTAIGELNGALQLTKDTISATTDNIIPDNTLLYIEFVKSDETVTTN